jgi:hypothetical protein
MIKAFTVSILSLFSSSVQIAFINENTEGYLEKVGLLKLTRDICPGKRMGWMGTLGFRGKFATIFSTKVCRLRNLSCLGVLQVM